MNPSIDYFFIHTPTSGKVEFKLMSTFTTHHTSWQSAPRIRYTVASNRTFESVRCNTRWQGGG